MYFNNILIYLIRIWGLGIGDWGLAQSPIPNPQSPVNYINYTINKNYSF